VRAVLGRAAAAAAAAAAARPETGARYVRGLVVVVHEDRAVDVAFDHAGTSRVPANRVQLTDRVVSSEPGAAGALALEVRPGMRCRVRAYLRHGAVEEDASAHRPGDRKLAGGDSLGAADAVEVLHALVADAQGRRFLATFQVGRVTLLVPAADFDLPLPAAVEAPTTERTLYCCSHRVFGMCQLPLLLLIHLLLLPLHVLYIPWPWL
jgi:hypothetical protein